MRVALLHPGDMGVTVGQALKASGHSVRWFSKDRSPASRARAESAGFGVCGTSAELFQGLEAVVSVCPPGAALAQARWVRDSGYSGPYLDANAVSPATARAISLVAGPLFVDGGIIGPPARETGTTRLYLSGTRAEEAASWFAAGPLQAIAIGAEPGSASALKMCYAAYTKGLSALLLNVRALAESEAVTPSLLEEWSLSQAGLAQRSEITAQVTAGKAWRFVDEMLEIAETFENRGLPGGFHRGAADVYRRMTPLKTAAEPSLNDVLRYLLHEAQ